MTELKDNLILAEATVSELVLAAQDGSRAAFGELFRRYEQHVLAAALRHMGNFSEAQELCQDVFMQALVKIGQLRTPEAFGGWLRSITHRMAVNRIVRRDPDVAVEPETLVATCVEERTPLAEALRHERHNRVRSGLARLRRLDRETLEAFYVHGRSLVEMSDEFAAPVGTIKRRLHVARKRLAKEVEELVAV